MGGAVEAVEAVDDPAHDPLVDRTSRSGNLDILRGIAAVMVLLVHAYGLGGRVVPLGAPDPAFSARWLGDALFLFGASGVALFFALSGYLITRPFVRSLVAGEPLPSVGAYAIRRTARIYPLYWVVLTGAILVGGGFGPSDDRGYFPVHYLLLHNLVRDRQNAILNVAWSLSLELLFYITVPLAAALIAYLAYRQPVRASTLATIVGVTWLASIAYGYATYVNGATELSAYFRLLFPGALAMFCPGMLVAIAEHSLHGSRWRWWLQELPTRAWVPALAAGCLIAAVWIEKGLRYDGPTPDTRYFLLFDLANPLFALGYGLIVARAVRAKPWGGRLRPGLVELGMISYGVYLIHALVVYALATTSWGNDLIPMPHGGLVAFLVHAGFVLAIVLPLAWISWHGFERPILVRAVAAADRLQDRDRPRPGREDNGEARPAVRARH
jgi:peptidoglycan/LPS O-acetylase OafA/YrhL